MDEVLVKGKNMAKKIRRVERVVSLQTHPMDHIENMISILDRMEDRIQQMIKAERNDGRLRGYIEQIDDIGKILVRAKILTRKEIARQGVRFALRDRFEPPERSPARAR